MTEEQISQKLQKFVSESIIAGFHPPINGTWEILTSKENTRELESKLIPNEEIEEYVKGLEEEMEKEYQEDAKTKVGDTIREQGIKQIDP